KSNKSFFLPHEFYRIKMDQRTDKSDDENEYHGNGIEVKSDGRSKFHHIKPLPGDLQRRGGVCEKTAAEDEGQQGGKSYRSNTGNRMKNSREPTTEYRQDQSPCEGKSDDEPK